MIVLKIICIALGMLSGSPILQAAAVGAESAQIQCQRRVEENNGLVTLVGAIGVKTSVLMSISPARPLRSFTGEAAGSVDYLAKLGDTSVGGYVGFPADAQAALRLTHLNILRYFGKTEADIPLRVLAMQLADDIHRRFRKDDEILTYNCLLLGPRMRKGRATSLELLKIDLSGNFYACKAVAAGYRASYLNIYLKEKFSKKLAEYVLDKEHKDVTRKCDVEWVVRELLTGLQVYTTQEGNRLSLDNCCLEISVVCLPNHGEVNHYVFDKDTATVVLGPTVLPPGLLKMTQGRGEGEEPDTDVATKNAMKIVEWLNL